MLRVDFGMMCDENLTRKIKHLCDDPQSLPGLRDGADKGRFDQISPQALVE